MSTFTSEAYSLSELCARVFQPYTEVALASATAVTTAAAAAATANPALWASMRWNLSISVLHVSSFPARFRSAKRLRACHLDHPRAVACQRPVELCLLRR